MKRWKPTDFNDCAAEQMIIGRDLIRLAAKMKEGQMNSNDWVAEHVMGFERGNCQGAMGGGNASSDGECETWFRCDWCGRHIYDGKTPKLHWWGDGHRVGEPTLIEPRESGPCPKYPFPKFTLVDLMRKLGEKGNYTMVRYGQMRPQHRFTVTMDAVRVADTDDPLQALCDYVYQNRLYPQVTKHFVSGEQVFEEYIPGYEQPKGPVDWSKLDWGLLCSRGECGNRWWNRYDPRIVAVLGESQADNYTVEKAMDEMCGIACRVCPYTTPESRLAHGCVWRTGIPIEPKPILFANIRDAIKLLQKAVGQVEGK